MRWLSQFPLSLAPADPFDGQVNAIVSTSRTPCRVVDPAVEVADASSVDPVAVGVFNPLFGGSLTLISGTAD